MPNMEGELNTAPGMLRLLTHPPFQTAGALVALAVILVMNLSVWVFRPYDGMSSMTNGGGVIVEEVIPGGPAERAGFRPGDRLLSVDGRAIDNWLRAPLYRPFTPAGSVVVYQIVRDGQELRLPLRVDGLFQNIAYFLPAISIGLLALIFWGTGFLMILFAPVVDVRARVIGLSWLLVGVGLAAGTPGAVSCFWGQATLMKAALAMLAFTNTAQHLLFPAESFSAIWRWRIVRLFGLISLANVALTVVDDAIFKTIWLYPSGLSNLVYLEFLLSAALSFALLIRNRFAASEAEIRRQTHIILMGTLLGVCPFLILTYIPSIFFAELTFIPWAVMVLFFGFIPLSYAYVIYQRRLLRLDFAINRLVVLTIFALLVLGVSWLVLGSLAVVFDLSPQLPLFGGLMTLAFSLPAGGLQGKIQVWVNRVLYGAHYDHTTVTSRLSRSLAQALDRQTLAQLLTQDLARQMGVGKIALLLRDGNQLALQPAGEYGPWSLDDELCNLLSKRQAPLQAAELWERLPMTAQTSWSGFAWAQVFVPILFESRLNGVLILGERTANDLYSGQDIRIVSTVADQAAVAIANVLLVEKLRGLTQHMTRLEEEQRQQVARDLHDTVLQNIFFAQQKLHEQPDVDNALNTAIAALRQTIKAQRPPLLDQDLALALRDLVAEGRKLAGKGGPEVAWKSNLEQPVFLPSETATNLYRIAQEALANALKHADAEQIVVALEKAGNSLCLSVEDDGVGMSAQAGEILTEGHFGLAGMRERAAMCGAQLKIFSECDRGTRVEVKFLPSVI